MNTGNNRLLLMTSKNRSLSGKFLRYLYRRVFEYLKIKSCRLIWRTLSMLLLFSIDVPSFVGINVTDPYFSHHENNVIHHVLK